MLYDPYIVGQAGEVPAEQEIASAITREILPQLRTALAKLNAIKQTSLVNGVPAMIEQAAQDGTALAGFPASTWQAWDEAFELLQAFISEEQATLGGATVAQVLLKRYTVQA